MQQTFRYNVSSIEDDEYSMTSEPEASYGPGYVTLMNAEGFEECLSTRYKTANEIILISPWIKQHGFNERIEEFIEFLSNEENRLYIVYSGEEVIIKNDNESLKIAKEMEKEYSNFFLIEFPFFHYKQVFFKGKRKIEYCTGSYNILSSNIQKATEEPWSYVEEDMVMIESKLSKDKYEECIRKIFNYYKTRLEHSDSQKADLFVKCSKFQSYDFLKSEYSKFLKKYECSSNELDEFNKSYEEKYPQNTTKSTTGKLINDQEELFSYLCYLRGAFSSRKPFNILFSTLLTEEYFEWLDYIQLSQKSGNTKLDIAIGKYRFHFYKLPEQFLLLKQKTPKFNVEKLKLVDYSNHIELLDNFEKQRPFNIFNFEELIEATLTKNS